MRSCSLATACAVAVPSKAPVAERHADVPRLDGGLWHAYRRKWATERGDVPLKALMVAGGWKDMQTLLTCYQQPSETALLEVMAHPVKLRERKGGGGA